MATHMPVENNKNKQPSSITAFRDEVTYIIIVYLPCVFECLKKRYIRLMFYYIS